MQETYVARAYAGESDIAAIIALDEASAAADATDNARSVTETRVIFSSPLVDAPRDVRVWQTADGQPAGVGIVMRVTANGVMDGRVTLRVQPDLRGRGLEDTILAWGEARVREAAAEAAMTPRVRVSYREPATFYRDLYIRHGYTQVRYFFEMTRPLDQPIPPPRFPDGLTLSHANGSTDSAKWVDCFNQSFIDHWNHHPTTVEQHNHWLSDPHYRPDLDLVAVTADGTFAAFCGCEINPDDNAQKGRSVGWIGVLGTRRGFRKIGLGRAMLLAGLQTLKAAGVAEARLDVDADSPTGALGLYEANGFRTIATDVVLMKEI